MKHQIRNKSGNDGEFYQDELGNESDSNDEFFREPNNKSDIGWVNAPLAPRTTALSYPVPPTESRPWEAMT